MADDTTSTEQDPSMAGSDVGFVIYGDFNCPFSAVAHRRAMRLVERGAAVVDWRCVEHDPTVPSDGSALGERERAALAGELDQIRGLPGADEADVLQVPSQWLNTARLNTVCASLPPARRAAFRQSVFDAYWCDGRDLTDPAVLDRLASGPTAAGEHVAERWQTEWESFERRIVPMMRRPDGELSRGLGTLARLG